MTQPTDPFAKGQMLKCVCRESAPYLIFGKVYESLGVSDEHVAVAGERGVANFYASRFESVPAAGEECAGGFAVGQSVTHICDPERGPAVVTGPNPNQPSCCVMVQWPGREPVSALVNNLRAHRSVPPQPEQAKAAVTITCVGECRIIDHRSGCCSLCGKPEQAKADPKKHGYDRERFQAGLMPDTHQGWEMEKLPANEAARLRNIAALKAEHAASSKRSGLLETFPKDARNPR
jgi:hypothetical protein